MSTKGHATYDVVFLRTSYSALLEAFLAVDAHQWRRRAEQLDAARPRLDDPTEFRGRATTDADLAERHRRLTEAAEACRRRAAFVDASRAAFEGTLHSMAHGEGAA